MLLFAFPRVEEMGLYVIYEWVGTQIGENFGASLAAADINGDGLSDLVVGAPMFFTPDASDMGKVVVYKTAIVSGLLLYAIFGKQLPLILLYLSNLEWLHCIRSIFLH